MTEIAPEIHKLVQELNEGNISESEFVEDLSKIDQRHPNPDNIGKALEKGMRESGISKSDKDRIWGLVKSVNPEIKSKYEEWADASNWNI